MESLVSTYPLPVVRLEAPKGRYQLKADPGGFFHWPAMPTAFVIDGAFFLRRFRWSFPGEEQSNPIAVAAALQWMTFWHIAARQRANNPRSVQPGAMSVIEGSDYYRAFFYDCPPLVKKMHRPISKTAIDLGKTPEANFRVELHEELRKLRKVALRLGRLNEAASEWRLKPISLKRLLSAKASQLTDDDFDLDTKQKGVDMRLGLDVASLAFKRQVDQIILVAGDADFVPAAKLARREGIDVVLDPMGANAARDLLQHVDGVRQCRREPAQP